MDTTTDRILDGGYDDLPSLIFTALGAASACWEHLDGAGVFDSDRAKRIGDELLDLLPAYMPPTVQATLTVSRAELRTMVQADPEAFGLDGSYEPRLGCATTAQLLMELDARLGASVSEGENALAVDPDAVRRRGELRDFRDGLTGEQLAYRTIDS